MPFQSIPAFSILDADVNLEASLILSDHPDAVETDPRVSIHDRHYGVSVGINLSDLRRLMLAVEKAADLHTNASPVGRLAIEPVRPEPPRAETPEEREAREAQQKADFEAQKAAKIAAHEAELQTVTNEERKLAAALTDRAAETVGAMIHAGIGAVNERGVWRYVRDGESWTQPIKGLTARGLVKSTYYTGGKADAWLTEEGQRVALALEDIGRIDREGDLVAGWSK